MRFKMSIVRDNPICCNCKLNLETLTHIFLNCPHTKSFIILLRSFILLKIDPTYRDQNCKYFITVNHSKQIINYLNMIAKLYISRQFQNEQPLAWDSFKRLIGLVMVGERECIKKALMTSCSSRLWQCIVFSLVWVPHCPHSARTYLFVLIYSKVLQPWCLSGVSINLAFKICIFLKTAKKTAKQDKKQKIKNRKREKKGEKKEKIDLKSFFGGIIILKLSDRD